MAGSTGNTLVSSPIITGPDSSQTLTLRKAMRIQNPHKDLQNKKEELGPFSAKDVTNHLMIEGYLAPGIKPADQSLLD